MERIRGDELETLDEVLDTHEDLVPELPGPPPPPLPARRDKPGHRQPPPPQRTKVGELPWWATSSRAGFTARAEQERERMSASKVAKFVNGNVSD